MADFNDGAIPFGVQVVTIGASGFVAENLSYTEPSNIIERRDEDGDPSGQVIIPGFGSGSATLQLAAITWVVPTRGATFNVLRKSGATFGAIISEVGESYSQLEAVKVNISFRRRYN
jgi:hypothetical protein